MNAASKQLLELTDVYVSNELSDNMWYMVVPSNPEKSDHLTSFELEQLDRVNCFAGEGLSATQVITLLWLDRRVPLYINMEVWKSEGERTLIQLLCSRRYRQDQDLLRGTDTNPPFHIQVGLPPEYQQGQKIDVNWKCEKPKSNWLQRSWSTLKRLILPGYK